MARYPVDRLYEEVAFVAYHFNWSRAEVMHMPHGERQRWCEEISRINDRMNNEAGVPEPSSREAGSSSGITLTQPVDFDE